MKATAKYNIGCDREILVLFHPYNKDLVIISWIHTDEEIEEMKINRGCTAAYATVEGMETFVEKEMWVHEYMTKMLMGENSSGDHHRLSENTIVTFDHKRNRMILQCQNWWHNDMYTIALKHTEVDKLMAIFKKMIKEKKTMMAQE